MTGRPRLASVSSRNCTANGRCLEACTPHSTLRPIHHRPHSLTCSPSRTPRPSNAACFSGHLIGSVTEARGPLHDSLSFALLDPVLIGWKLHQAIQLKERGQETSHIPSSILLQIHNKMGSVALSNDHLQRAAEHEDEDYERTVRRILDQEFDDWPNEAGVSHSLSLCPGDD